MNSGRSASGLEEASGGPHGSFQDELDRMGRLVNHVEGALPLDPREKKHGV
jgi:hypothetical protein